MRRIFVILIFSVTFALCFILYGPGGLLQPISSIENPTIIIEKGESLSKIATKLTDLKIITQKITFIAGALFLKLQKMPLKHGEYLIEYNQSLWQMLQKISKGAVVIHYLTIPEGLTVHEVSKKIEDITILTGTIERLPLEGTLLPQTYDYRHGDSKSQLMQRMEKEMLKVKNLTWSHHQNSCPLKTWDEVLTLASIIEKETAVGSERDLVASVYLNRLKINMPLQADPTIIYAATQGQTSFYRPIFKSDLALNSPYNTYLQKGLPPTPIACPGEASIMAVLNPASTSYLYFVANGDGGHEFSCDLKTHNQNVRSWRLIEKKKKER